MSTPEVVSRVGSVVATPAGPEALGFIVDSWCRSFERSALATLGLPSPEAIPPGMRRLVCSSIHARVKATIAKPTTRALVLVHEDRPEVLLGHLVYEPGTPGTVHYAYVLESLRHMGLASMLLEAAHVSGASATHFTRAGAALFRRFSLTYSPQEA